MCDEERGVSFPLVVVTLLGFFVCFMYDGQSVEEKATDLLIHGMCIDISMEQSSSSITDQTDRAGVLEVDLYVRKVMLTGRLSS